MRSAVTLHAHEWPPPSPAADAPVAFLVHGVASWHRTWWRVGPALAAKGWRALAVDLRAHGTSPSEVATIDDLAHDLEAAIERHAGPPIDALIGHSLGAVVSQRLAWLRPSIARRMVLEDPPGIVRSDDQEFMVRMRREVQAARERPDDEMRRERAENPAWLEQDVRQDVEGRALTDVEDVIASIRHGRGFEIADLAAQIRIPTRYVLASVDRSVMPEEPRRRLIANLPDGSDAVVLGGGHTLHRDCFEEYVATVLDFIG